MGPSAVQVENVTSTTTSGRSQWTDHLVTELEARRLLLEQRFQACLHSNSERGAADYRRGKALRLACHSAT